MAVRSVPHVHGDQSVGRNRGQSDQLGGIHRGQAENQAELIYRSGDLSEQSRAIHIDVKLLAKVVDGVASDVVAIKTDMSVLKVGISKVLSILQREPVD